MNQRAPAEQAVCPSVLTPAFVITSYDHAEWEKFSLEYLGAAVPSYALLEPKGGAGDKGRDIVAHTTSPPGHGPIDIYQCKAYSHKLGPSNIWSELGKLCVYTMRGDYPMPRRYRFLAPHGVGTKLGDLLKRPDDLRKNLMANWQKHCQNAISKADEFPLEGTLQAHVESFDFTIVGYVPVHDILHQHSRTSHWHMRFRRDPPKRPPSSTPPIEIQAHELRYTRQLWAAYGDHLKCEITCVGDLRNQPPLVEHFERSRTDFFMADGLNRFYRDSFPGGAFEHIKRQVYDGVIDVATASHADGYERVKITVQEAARLNLSQTEYSPYVEPGDKKGVCHHLANEDNLKWVQS